MGGMYFLFTEVGVLMIAGSIFDDLGWFRNQISDPLEMGLKCDDASGLFRDNPRGSQILKSSWWTLNAFILKLN